MKSCALALPVSQQLFVASSRPTSWSRRPIDLFVSMNGLVVYLMFCSASSGSRGLHALAGKREVVRASSTTPGPKHYIPRCLMQKDAGFAAVGANELKDGGLDGVESAASSSKF